MANTVQSVERAFAVLEAFDEDHPSRSAAEIASIAGLARPTTYRLLQTLQQLGYVRSAHGRYEVTPRVLRLGAGYLGLSLMVKLGGIAWWPRLAVANWVVAFGLGDGPDAPVAAGIIIVPLLWMLWTSLLDMNSGVETPDYMAGED